MSTRSLAAQIDGTVTIAGRTQAVTFDVHTDHGAVCSVLWGVNELLPELDDNTIEAIQAYADENA